MYTNLFIVILHTTACFCYAGYELFQGFTTDVDDISDTTTEETFLDSFFKSVSKTSQTTSIPKGILNQNMSTSSEKPLSTKLKFNTYKDFIEATSLRPSKFECPEDEKPANIGAYEIPTQRDMVLFTRNVLLDMFNSYNQEAFYLLKDIRAATKATSKIERTCKRNQMAYRKCVKHVSKQCEQITKNLVKSLENKKQHISNITEAKICNLAEMTTDPIEVLKSLAQEKVYLEFALPGFLRLLSACNLNCVQSASASNYYEIKPMRHMTDQDLVIKHFLTSKNYLELIMDSRHKTMANSN